MSGDWYFEMQVYRRKYNRLVRKYNATVKKMQFWKGLSEGGSGDVNYTKWRRAVMWSAAWKASAKKQKQRVAELEEACEAARTPLLNSMSNSRTSYDVKVDALKRIDAALNK